MLLSLFVRLLFLFSHSDCKFETFEVLPDEANVIVPELSSSLNLLLPDHNCV